MTVADTRENQSTKAALRVIMAIDHLEPGGAQRQFALLAKSLRRIGYDVEAVVFRPDYFFGDALQNVGIPIVFMKSRNRLHLWFLMRREIQRWSADIVIGFLPWSNLMVELAGLPRRKFAIIVSERGLDVTRSIKRRLAYHGHRLADVIVSNSHTQEKIVSGVVMRWKVRSQVIVNGVDTQHFRPAGNMQRRERDNLRLFVLARLSPEKNVIRFIDAVSEVRARYPQIGLEVDWYGKSSGNGADDDVAWALSHRNKLTAYYHDILSAIARHNLQGCFRISGPTKEVRELYQQADVVCMPSLYEGCSNVIAEAMARGIPVLASRVGDNMRLVQEDRNGFLFDPMSVDEMARAIVRFSDLTPSERIRFGREGRKMAEEMLSVEVFTERYTKLIDELGWQRRS